MQRICLGAPPPKRSSVCILGEEECGGHKEKVQAGRDDLGATYEMLFGFDDGEGRGEGGRRLTLNAKFERGQSYVSFKR